jgi:hypothetical protein
MTNSITLHRTCKRFWTRKGNNVAWKNTCPQCGKHFRKLDRLKEHMTVHHGGFTQSEIVGAVSDPENPDVAPVEAANSNVNLFGETDPAPERTSEPRRSTRRNRELNDKVNACFGFLLRKLLGKMPTPEETAQFEKDREEIQTAALGVELDFEEKVTKKISSKWALIAMLVALYLIPQIPPIPFQQLIAQMKAGGKKKNEPNKNNRDNRPEGERKDLPIGPDVREN